MPPRTKYEDAVYEKVQFSGKIFMYNQSSWDTLYPVVDIIRLLKKNTIIGTMVGKGQQNISIYGNQYNHRMLSYELKTKKDYLQNLKAVRNIFIFSDSHDNTAKNLINTGSSNKINVVCYSNIDKVYHFYDNINEQVFKFGSPSEVLEKMYYLADLESTRKIADLFPDIEILEPSEKPKNSSLEECTKILKDKKGVISKFYDPNLAKLRAMEYQRSTRNTVYPDSMEELAKDSNRKTILSRFFK
jgi:hypothetical protein